jgi:hypothetical protein
MYLLKIPCFISRKTSTHRSIAISFIINSHSTSWHPSYKHHSPNYSILSLLLLWKDVVQKLPSMQPLLTKYDAPLRNLTYTPSTHKHFTISKNHLPSPLLMVFLPSVGKHSLLPRTMMRHDTDQGLQTYTQIPTSTNGNTTFRYQLAHHTKPLSQDSWSTNPSPHHHVPIPLLSPVRSKLPPQHKCFLVAKLSHETTRSVSKVMDANVSPPLYCKGVTKHPLPLQANNESHRTSTHHSDAHTNATTADMNRPPPPTAQGPAAGHLYTHPLFAPYMQSRLSSPHPERLGKLKRTIASYRHKKLSLIVRRMRKSLLLLPNCAISLQMGRV